MYAHFHSGVDNKQEKYVIRICMRIVKVQRRRRRPRPRRRSTLKDETLLNVAVFVAVAVARSFRCVFYSALVPHWLPVSMQIVVLIERARECAQFSFFIRSSTIHMLVFIDIF